MEQVLEQREGHFFPQQVEFPKIYVIHENPEWVLPLWEELNLLGLPYEDWFINEGGFDLAALPPEGIFYNRMSASSHTRGHRFAVELANPLLTWLETNGRRVINGANTINTEVNKANQYLMLKASGIQTPYTLIANNNQQLIELARVFNDQPFIVKPNRGGKGLGVQLFHSIEALKWQLENNPDFESLDGIYLLQQYIKPPESEIVRMEFIGGKFYYAVAVDTSGGFELCPADACEIEDQFCPTTPGETEKPKFRIIEGFQNPDIPKIEGFLQRNRIDIAGIEFLTDSNGKRYVYDINTNTNYNGEAEKNTAYQWKGMREVAQFLSQEFKKAYIEI